MHAHSAVRRRKIKDRLKSAPAFLHSFLRKDCMRFFSQAIKLTNEFKLINLDPRPTCSHKKDEYWSCIGKDDTSNAFKDCKRTSNPNSSKNHCGDRGRYRAVPVCFWDHHQKLQSFHILKRFSDLRPGWEPTYRNESRSREDRDAPRLINPVENQQMDAWMPTDNASEYKLLTALT